MDLISKGSFGFDELSSINFVYLFLLSKFLVYRFIYEDTQFVILNGRNKAKRSKESEKN